MKRHILIVDNEPMLCESISELIKFYFEDSIYTAKANTYAEALRLFRESPFDIIITDIHLPDSSGLDLIALIHQVNPDMEFVVITGGTGITEGGDQAIVKKIPAAQFSFLRKPFANDELYFLLAKILGKLTVEKSNAALLEELQRLAETGSIVAGVVHDVKKYTTGISMSLDMFLLPALEDVLEPNEVSQDIIETVREALENANQCTNFAESLLTVNRADQDIQEVDAVKFTQQAITLLSCQMMHSGVEWEFDQEGAKPINVVGNTQLIRVVMNLIANAIDALKTAFTPAPKIKIKIEEGGKNQDQVLIHVIDNGPGIPSDVLAKIQQGLRITTKGDLGNGFGLTGAMKIVKDCDGDMIVKSQMGMGASFTIQLHAGRVMEVTYLNKESFSL